MKLSAGRTLIALLLAACGAALAFAVEDAPPKDPLPSVVEPKLETDPPGPTLELPPSDKPPKLEPAEEGPKAKSAREYFELSGINESFLRFLTDGEKFGAGERETLYKLLESMPELTPFAFHVWRKDVSWEQLVEKPADYRLEAIRVPLRVKQVDILPLPRELAMKLEFKSYYQVQGEIADRPGEQVVVFTRRIPKAWEAKLGQPLDELADAEAVFLKLGEKGKDLPTFYFVADRIGWKPDRPNKELGVPATWVELAKRGLDVSRFDDIHDRGRISVYEKEAFYEMLTAIGKIPPDEIVKAAPAHSELGPLVNKPAELRGSLATVEGVCRKATKVMVTEEDIRARFGITHYYELIIFLNERVKFQQPDAPDKSVEFNSYPVFCCVLELPPGIPANADINEQVRVSGYYFKLYAYSSQKMEQEQKRLGLPTDMQLSPLLMSVRATWIEPKKAETNPYVAGGIALAALVLIVAGAASAWNYHSPAAELAKQAVGPIGLPGTKAGSPE